jgi:hypothetical protein
MTLRTKGDPAAWRSFIGEPHRSDHHKIEGAMLAARMRTRHIPRPDVATTAAGY